MEKVLITGGAGFIGRFVADELLRRGHQVRVLDALIPQVHGEGAGRPEALNSEAEFIHGDVRDADAVTRALKGVDSVIHLAAEVGVATVPGSSFYRPGHPDAKKYIRFCFCKEMSTLQAAATRLQKLKPVR